jgi:hypothetical protein
VCRMASAINIPPITAMAHTPPTSNDR